MIHLAKQFVVFVSLLCYLTAVSVASAHVSSMMEMSASEPDYLMTSMDYTGEGSDENCHSTKSFPGDQSESKTCKIFCAAMAQAMAQAGESVPVGLKPAISIATFQAPILSRQLSVEPHPPK